MYKLFSIILCIFITFSVASSEFLETKYELKFNFGEPQFKVEYGILAFHVIYPDYLLERGGLASFESNSSFIRKITMFKYNFDSVKRMSIKWQVDNDTKVKNGENIYLKNLEVKEVSRRDASLINKLKPVKLFCPVEPNKPLKDGVYATFELCN